MRKRKISKIKFNDTNREGKRDNRKHKILEKELSSGSIEKKLFASKSKEYSELNSVINHAKDYLTFDKTRDDLKKL